MANTTKTTSAVKLEFKFSDNDTRTVSMDNPRAGLSKADILNVADIATLTGAIVGDKTGAAVVGINSAYTENTTVTTLDLGGISSWA